MHTIYNHNQVTWNTGAEKELFAGNRFMNKRKRMVDGLMSQAKRTTGITIKVEGAAEKVGQRNFNQLFADLLRRVKTVADFNAILTISGSEKLLKRWNKAIKAGIKHYKNQENQLRVKAKEMP